VPGGEFNPPRVSSSLGSVIKLEPPTHFAGFHAHRRVVAGIICRRPAEYLDANGPLFEDFGPSCQCRFDHVPQEVLAAMAGTKLFAGQNPLEGATNLFFVLGPTAHAVSSAAHRRVDFITRQSCQTSSNFPVIMGLMMFETFQ